MKKAVLHYLILGVFALLSQYVAAQPSISGLSASSSSGNNLTNDDLTCNYTMTGSTIVTATLWYKNSTSTNRLYLPFEGGASNALRDFSPYHFDASMSTDSDEQPVYNLTGGYDGNGAFTFNGNDYLECGEALPSGSYTKTAWINIATAASGFRNIISSEENLDRNHHFKIDPNGQLNAGHSFGEIIVEDSDSLNLLKTYGRV